MEAQLHHTCTKYTTGKGFSQFLTQNIKIDTGCLRETDEMLKGTRLRKVPVIQTSV